MSECPSGSEPNPEDHRELVRLLDAHLCTEHDLPHRDLVLATTLGGVKLARYVDAHFPTRSDTERRRTYRRFKRRRERAIRRLAASLRARIGARREAA